MRFFAMIAVASLMLVCSHVTAARAEDVTLEFQGLQLNGNLSIAAGKSLKTDGVVLLVHDTLAHDRVELMAALQDGLHDAGMNSLAITLGLGLDNRKGMFNCSVEQDHRHEDAIDEISAWVQWLHEKGANSITVVGHGRGANQVALYSINRLDKSVKRIVLVAPLMQTEEKAQTDYQARYGQPLKQELGRAEELVANEQGNQLIDVPGFLICPHAKVTAGAFANYYGANPKFQTLNLLHSLKVPAMIAIGDADPSQSELEAARPDFAGIKSIVTVIIPGADHDFRDAGGDELAKKIKEFITQKL